MDADDWKIVSANGVKCSDSASARVSEHLKDGWILLSNCTLGNLQLSIVMIRPDGGVALFEVGERWTPGLVEMFHVELSRAGFSSAYPGHLPVLHRRLRKDDIAHLPFILEEAFAFEEPIGLSVDSGWSDALQRLMQPQPEAPAILHPGPAEVAAPGMSTAMVGERGAPRWLLGGGLALLALGGVLLWAASWPPEPMSQHPAIATRGTPLPLAAGRRREVILPAALPAAPAPDATAPLAAPNPAETMPAEPLVAIPAPPPEPLVESIPMVASLPPPPPQDEVPMDIAVVPLVVAWPDNLLPLPAPAVLSVSVGPPWLAPAADPEMTIAQIAEIPVELDPPVPTIAPAPADLAPPPPVVMPPAQQAVPSPPAREADPALTRLLLRRAEAMLALGDISGARRLLERAEATGNVDAAIRLAETYDPAFLPSLNTRGLQPDPAIALGWYRRAAARGASVEQRIKRLEAAP